MRRREMAGCPLGGEGFLKKVSPAQIATCCPQERGLKSRERNSALCPTRICFYLVQKEKA